MLEAKGEEVVTIHPNASLADAAHLLARHHIGALAVIDQSGALCGVVSERDVIHSLAAHGAALQAIRVGQVMTRKAMTCTPKDHVTSLMTRMTEGRLRHLPVVQGNALCGIISIGDVVKSRLAQLEAEHEQLQAYISGTDMTAGFAAKSEESTVKLMRLA